MTSKTDRGGRSSVCGFALVVVLASLLVPLPAVAQNAGVIVITEIMYHPAGGGQELEFVEIHNLSSESMDLSGWFFSRGISFVFPEGVWLRGSEYLVVCADEDAVQREYRVFNTIGNWQSCSGSGNEGCALDNGGETIELNEASGIRAATVRYNDRGAWAVGADGAGHSLEIRLPSLEQDAAENWAMSARPGGSPGRANEPASNPRGVVLNEALLFSSEARFVELFNTSETEADVSGLTITDDRDQLDKFRIPSETVIAPRGWLAFSEAELGFDLGAAFEADAQPKIFLALSETDGTVIDAYNFRPEAEGESGARIPDGAPEFSDRAIPTRAMANAVSVETDVVINEINFHPPLDNNRAEFIELYNRNAERTIDLSGWSFTRGFNFSFPPGTSIAPQSYLVVARDPEYLREVHGLSESVVLGPDLTDPESIAAFGRLRDDDERVLLRDQHGNQVGTLHYQDGGEWSTWADGSGSTLELIDPFQDNTVAQAWDASDDSDKAPVQELSHVGFHHSGTSELHFTSTGRGMVTIDNLRVIPIIKEFDPERSTVFIGKDTEWKIFKGTEEPSEPREAWRQLDFDDSNWLSGLAPIGYGEGDENTLLDDMRRNYTTFYCRAEFTVEDPAALEDFALFLETDDAYHAYLNGTPLVSSNAESEAFDARSTESREQFREELSLQDRAHLLRAGRNVFAIQILNSSRFDIDARFVGRLGDGPLIDADGLTCPHHLYHPLC